MLTLRRLSRRQRVKQRPGIGDSNVTENANKPTLRIYIGKHCGSCEEAVRLAEEVRRKFAEVNVELIDLGAKGSVNLDDVFSTPTYVFNGRTISLGNPTAEELFAKVSASMIW
jgi:hypothetical protein